MSRNQSGFTLIEVLFALAIFTIILAGMPNFFITQSKLNTRSQLRTEAINAAKIQLDQLRLQDPVDMPASGVFGPEDIIVNDRTFEVSTEYCATAAFCPSVNTRHITVTVDYRDEERYRVETVFTRLR